MSTIYINKDTNSIIDSSYIVSNTDHGIIVNKNNCWQLFPSKSIQEEEQGHEYYKDNICPSIEQKSVSGILRNNVYNTFYTEVIRQEFGFENFKVFTRYPLQDSGIISNAISTDNAVRIQVDMETINIEHGSVEISILEGANETPILPIGTKQVLREKLFYRPELRFSADFLQGGVPVLYKNGFISDLDYLTISAEEMASNTYWVNYTAAGDVCNYYPNGNDIRIKLIIRQYDKEPVSITRFTIYKYGEPLAWTSKASD